MKLTSRFGCFVAIVAGMTVAAQHAQGEPGQEKKRWQRTTKWLVEALSEDSQFEGKAAGVPVFERNSLHRVVVATSDDRLSFWGGHPNEQERIDWKYEPFNLVMTLSKGEVATYRPFNRTVEYSKLPPGSQSFGTVRNDLICFFMPVWPLKGYPVPAADDSDMIFIVQAAMESPKYEITAVREVIDGEPCKLVRAKSGEDRIWVSEEKEFCIWRRRWYQNRDKDLAAELATKKVRELAPGLWLPVELELTHYVAKDDSDNLVAIARSVTRVLRCELDDDVSMQALDLVLQPGTIETSPNHDGFKQISPGGSEHLPEMAKFFRDRAVPRRSPTMLQRLLSAAPRFFVGALGGIVAGVILLRSRLANRFSRGNAGDDAKRPLP